MGEGKYGGILPVSMVEFYRAEWCFPSKYTPDRSPLLHPCMDEGKYGGILPRWVVFPK